MLVKTPTGPDVGAAAAGVVTTATAAAVAALAEDTTEDAAELAAGATVTAVAGAATPATDDTPANGAVLVAVAEAAFTPTAATAVLAGDDEDTAEDFAADFDGAPAKPAPVGELDTLPVLEPADAPPADDTSLAPLAPMVCC